MTIDTRRLYIMLAEKGMTKKDIAERGGISQQSVSTAFRRGTCSPPTVGKIARGLGVPVVDILKEE